MLFRFCLYGFLKNQRYFEPFLMLVFIDLGLSFFMIGLLLACRDLTVNLLEIPSGALADSFGRRGAMVVSFIAYIISFSVLAVASTVTSNIASLFLGMILYGVGDTFRTGTHKAMIFEWLRRQNRQDERTAIYGLTRSWSQIGSAVSSLIVAAFVLISGSYLFVFYLAIVPYLFNLINVSTYPQELDGEHQKATTIGQSWWRLKTSVLTALKKPALRGLVIESMSWEGFFGAVKDYLQPILQSVAILLFAGLVTGAGTGVGHAAPSTAINSPFASLNQPQMSALLVGPIYAILFLASAWASRNAHRVVKRSVNIQSASRRLWYFNWILYLTLAAAAILNFSLLLVTVFVTLHILKNVWRPILITRFDSLSRPEEGATVLSIESQSQRLATLFWAPVMGSLVDWASQTDRGPELWPIGVTGAIIAATVLMTIQRNARQPNITDDPDRPAESK
jgi:MFS family permease